MRETDPFTLYCNILESNKNQFLKSIYSPFNTGTLVNMIGRDGGGDITEEILSEDMNSTIIVEMDKSAERTNFMAALKKNNK